MKFLTLAAAALAFFSVATPSMAANVLSDAELAQVTAGAVATAVNGTRVARATALGPTAVVSAVATTTGSSATSNSAAVVSE